MFNISNTLPPFSGETVGYVPDIGKCLPVCRLSYPTAVDTHCFPACT